MLRRKEEKIITYLEEVDSSSADEELNSNDIGNELTTRGFEDEIERRKLKWWEFLLYKKEMRIFYLILLCIGLVIGVPSLMEYTGYITSQDSNSKYSGTCGVKDSFRVDCLPDINIFSVEVCEFRGCCVDRDENNVFYCYHRLPSPVSMTYESRSPDGSSGVLTGPGYTESTTRANYKVTSDHEGHVLFEVGSVLSPGLTGNQDAPDPLVTTVSCPGGNCDPGTIMTIDVGFVDGDMTSIARSHFGPIVYDSSELTEISFYLASNFIFGKEFPDFIFNGTEIISYFNLGKESQVHLPIILGRLDNGEQWFLVYLETDQPGSQEIKLGSGSQPILTWRFMGGNIKVHFMIDNHPANLSKKFNSYISGPTSKTPAFNVLKYGYHMCRKVGDVKAFQNDIDGMKNINMPYDSDCIDELFMPTAFNNDTAYDISNVTAKIVLPIPVQIEEEEEPSPECLREDSKVNATCYRGEFNAFNVTFPDVFHTNYPIWLTDKFSESGIDKSAIYFHDLAPTDESENNCNNDLYIPKGLNKEDVPCLDSWLPSANTKLLNVSYAKQFLKVSNSILGVESYIRSDVATVGMPNSITFTGSKVPASWQGMKSSLREVLFLSSIGLPFVSMPACGTYSQSNTLNRDVMCLRWFQLACFMPSIHSWYSGDQNSRLPYNLPKTYQRYVRWALEQRYKLLPYMKTLDRGWYNNSLPIIRPVFLEHPDRDYLHHWTQFFLGKDILVAPVLDDNTELVNIHFPMGSWYNLGSGNMVSLPRPGAEITVRTTLYEIPTFIRGGAVIVMYESAGNGTLIEADQVSDYTVYIGLECTADPRSQIQENNNKMSRCYASGESYLNTETNILKTALTTSPSRGTITFKMDVNPDDKLRNINSIRMSGLQNNGDILTISLPGGVNITATDSIDTSVEDGPSAVYSKDKQYLLLRNLKIDSSTYQNTVFSWEFSAENTI